MKQRQGLPRYLVRKYLFMNKSTLLFIFLLLASLSKIMAQAMAGVVGNLSANNNTSAETVNIVPVFLPGQFDPEAQDSLDFNRDGQYDVGFRCTSCDDIDCVGGSTSASPLHSNVEFMLDGDNFIRQLNTGDAIDKNQIWGWADISILTHRVYGVGGYTELGNWYPQIEGYAGVRIFSGQDTLYGWIKIKAFANPNGGAYVQVNQWAIEEVTASNQPVDFIIAGATSDLVPVNQTIVLEQGSVPFGTTSGKIDSLDLNQDGQFDAVFLASVCNTFDCQIGRTHCVGMHDGFTFVQGPIDARRFEQGDTIWANANWNTSPGPYRFARLVESGLGFNGFQNGGEWLNQNLGYLGFRLATPASDTLFGWIYIHTYSLNENGAYVEILGWAIQHDPSQSPYATLKKTPEKSIYCAGDSVVFEANAVGAEQIMWHFWDGTSDSAAVVTKILPDSAVTATLEATNQNGTTTIAQTLEVSPLALTAPGITLDCAHPTATLTAGLSIPADVCWVIGIDTVCNPAPLTVNTPLPIIVFAEDQYGCVVAQQVEVVVDVAPPNVSITYNEANHLLIAQSNTPNVTFSWVSLNWPILNDSVFIAQSGTYTVVATAPNGCTATASIDVSITSMTDEPFAQFILIQPNPVSDFLQIENRFASDFYLKIFDSSGSLKSGAVTVAGNSISRFNVESLAAGLYFIVASDSDGKSLFFRKFVKQ